jgi:glycosyltransferase
MEEHIQLPYLVSIITVTYNCADSLRQTIESVAHQDYPRIEYIVIDGNSQDETLQILKQHHEIISSYLSEPDHGIYDAMNKGKRLASGDFCLFLNAGDVFYESNSLRALVEALQSPQSICFGIAVMTDRNKIFRLRPLLKDKDVDTWLSSGGLPNHQTTLFPREFYATNDYDLSFEISSDQDYKIRALKNRSIDFLPKWIILFELGGMSKSNASLKIVRRRLLEGRMLQKKHGLVGEHGKLSLIKYELKSYFLWCLTNVFGSHYLFDLWFNKFKSIPPSEKRFFRPQY